MEKRTVFARIFAIIGTVLAWLPLVAPLVFAIFSLASDGRFRFDYLMPAEVFPVALAAGAVLIAGAILARSRMPLIIASFAAAVALLVASLTIAQLTGLASGRTEAAGWPFVLTMATLIGYELALAVLGVGGALLIRGLFRRRSVP